MAKYPEESETSLLLWLLGGQFSDAAAGFCFHITDEEFYLDIQYMYSIFDRHLPFKKSWLNTHRSSAVLAEAGSVLEI